MGNVNVVADGLLPVSQMPLATVQAEILKRYKDLDLEFGLDENSMKSLCGSSLNVGTVMSVFKRGSSKSINALEFLTCK